LDSGTGLDDKCIFVTDQGEVAVYEGTDPSSANTWGLVGVYQVGIPLDKHAVFQVGGDLLIMTKEGIVPISQAISKELTGLRLSAISFSIEDAWRSAVAGITANAPITASLWPDKGRLLIGTPEMDQNKDVCFVANAATGAWARYTGWQVRASTVFGGEMYVCDEAGIVCKADVGGDDNGTSYTAVWVPKFSDFGAAGVKMANIVGLTSRSAAAFDFGAQIFANYVVGEITNPSAIPAPASSSAWGSGVWGTMVWGDGGSLVAQQKWRVAYGTGFAIAPAVSITVLQTPTPVVEVINLQLRYEEGAVF
jgi:hypothetical protein